MTRDVDNASMGRRGSITVQNVSVRYLVLLAVVVSLAFSLDLAATPIDSCPSFVQSSVSVSISAIALHEISGLVASRTQSGILWVHNDSGDQGRVYAVNLQGQLLAEVTLLDARGVVVESFDCEDIALAPADGDGDVLYLADIGDNAGIRETICVYRFPEPIIDRSGVGVPAHLTVECESIEATYPDGPRDAETLLVDPLTGDILVISKDYIRARAYRLPVDLDGVPIMDFLLELSWGFITGGDISPDGTRILLRGYWHAQLWERTSSDHWWAALASLGCSIPLAPEPQGEAIGFSFDGDDYFTISEGNEPALNTFHGGPSDISH